jgi:hypothetical protein
MGPSNSWARRTASGSREPGDHVVRVLEVGGDVLLEGVVVDRVGDDLHVLVRKAATAASNPAIGTASE